MKRMIKLANHAQYGWVYIDADRIIKVEQRTSGTLIALEHGVFAHVNENHEQVMDLLSTALNGPETEQPKLAEQGDS